MFPSLEKETMLLFTPKSMYPSCRQQGRFGHVILRQRPHFGSLPTLRTSLPLEVTSLVLILKNLMAAEHGAASLNTVGTRHIASARAGDQGLQGTLPTCTQRRRSLCFVLAFCYLTPTRKGFFNHFSI